MSTSAMAPPTTLHTAMVEIDPRCSLGRPRVDVADLHRLTMRALPDAMGESPRSQANLLWVSDLVSGSRRMVVQSTSPDVDYSVWDSTPEVRLLSKGSATLEAETGQRFQFMLRACATLSVPVKGERGKRAPVTDHQRLIEWLSRQGEGAFHLADDPYFGVDVSVESEGAVVSQDKGATWSSTSFRGSLVVDDPTVFQQKVAEGVGRGKAYGFGLLRVRPL